VLRQEPAAGTQVAQGATVDLVVAKAPEEVAVPGVIDSTEEEATQALEDAGFKVRTDDAPVQTPDEDGIVVDQDPSPDTPRPKGSTVTITVGRFEPDVVPEPTATATPQAEP
jgi:serine/threonine-protein kinase